MINNRLHPTVIPLVVFVFAIIISTAALWNPGGHSPLLVNENGARWIRFPEPFRLRIHFAKKITTSFRTTVKAPAGNKKAVLTMRFAGEATVFIDKKTIALSPPPVMKGSAERQRVDISLFLTPGDHELLIEVSNTKGHPLLIAYAESLGLFTGENWETSKDGRSWLPAVPADKPYTLIISKTFPRLWPSFRSLALFYVSLFSFFFFWNLAPPRPGKTAPSVKPLTAGAVRWLVLVAWVAMAMNNFWKLPLEMGMDFKGHLQYILSLVESRRIPLATEGWQMFQQPLYYLLTSGIYGFSHNLFSDEVSIRIIKLFSVLCGMLQIEISYRTIKLLYPRRESIQIFGVIIAGLLPMNLYMSQSLGNEPLAGLLTALMIFTAIRMALKNTVSDWRDSLRIGFLFGLALLTKVSAVLVALPLFFFITSEILLENGRTWKSVKTSVGLTGLILLVAFLVSGWYYIRNYMEMGSFFIGGWDSARDIVWWQDPGYRTLRHLYSFGQSLYYPVFSSLYGFWDSIYSSFWADGYLSAYNRPPWNYRFMITGMWLALFPSAAIFAGVVAAVRMAAGKLRRVLLFSAGSVLLYLFAIFYIFMTVPFLSSAKASYALGLLPCFALLGAAGFDALTKNRYVGAAYRALLGCWAITSFACYFAM